MRPLRFNVTSVPPVLGRMNYPATTRVETWLGVNHVVTTNRSPTAPVTIGAYPGFSVVYAGALSGGQSLRVAGPNTTLGDFNGGGTVVLTRTNTIAGAGTVEAGATLQMGAEPTATTGTTAQAFTVNGTLNLFGAYPSARSVVGAGNVVANGELVNVEGLGTTGTGVINTFWNSVAVG